MECGVTCIRVACFSSILEKVDSIHSALSSMSFLELPSLIRGHSRATWCQFMYASFFSMSNRVLTPHSVTSCLVPIPPTISSRLAMSNTITLLSDYVDSSSSMTPISSTPTSRIVNLRSMIEVVLRRIGLVASPVSLFRIKRYPSIKVSRSVESLFLPQCRFYSGLWALKFLNRMAMPSIRLPQLASASTRL